MKIGTQTNSLINHLQSRSVIGESAPEVGMGATILGWTDRHPATIVKVMELSSKAYSHIIEVTDDSHKVISGSQHDGSAKYEFTSNPDGWRATYRKSRKTGMLERTFLNPETNKWKKMDGAGIHIGVREYYRDPSF